MLYSPKTFQIRDNCLLQYSGTDNEVIIPEGVIHIGEGAFQSCPNLMRIVFPEGLRIIDEKAFCDCMHLKELYLPDSTVSIGYKAFANCKGLVCARIPRSVINVNPYAFFECTSLKKILVASEDDVTAMDLGTFLRSIIVHPMFCDKGDEYRTFVLGFDDNIWGAEKAAVKYSSAYPIGMEKIREYRCSGHDAITERDFIKIKVTYNLNEQEYQSAVERIRRIGSSANIVLLKETFAFFDAGNHCIRENTLSYSAEGRIIQRFDRMFEYELHSFSGDLTVESYWFTRPSDNEDLYSTEKIDTVKRIYSFDSKERIASVKDYSDECGCFFDHLFFYDEEGNLIGHEIKDVYGTTIYTSRFLQKESECCIIEKGNDASGTLKESKYYGDFITIKGIRGISNIVDESRVLYSGQAFPHDWVEFWFDGTGTVQRDRGKKDTDSADSPSKSIQGEEWSYSEDGSLRLLVYTRKIITDEFREEYIYDGFGRLRVEQRWRDDIEDTNVYLYSKSDRIRGIYPDTEGLGLSRDRRTVYYDFEGKAVFSESEESFIRYEYDSNGTQKGEYTRRIQFDGEDFLLELQNSESSCFEYLDYYNALSFTVEYYYLDVTTWEEKKTYTIDYLNGLTGSYTEDYIYLCNRRAKIINSGGCADELSLIDGILEELAACRDTVCAQIDNALGITIETNPLVREWVRIGHLFETGKIGIGKDSWLAYACYMKGAFLDNQGTAWQNLGRLFCNSMVDPSGPLCSRIPCESSEESEYTADDWIRFYCYSFATSNYIRYDDTLPFFNAETAVSSKIPWLGYWGWGALRSLRETIDQMDHLVDIFSPLDETD